MNTRSKKRKQSFSGPDAGIPIEANKQKGNAAVKNTSVESVEPPRSKKRHAVNNSFVPPAAENAIGAPKAPSSAGRKKPKTRAVRNKNAKENADKSKKKKKAKFKVAFTNRKDAKRLSSSGNNELCLAKEELSCMSEEEKLLLTSWGLPPSVVHKYGSKGVTSLFPWQLECLANAEVLGGKNLLYSAPTSAGKTLVAEILMIKRVLELGKKAIMILPFVSVCREKMYGLQEIFGDAGIRVEGFMGSYAPPGGFKAVDIAICTIEKANSLINRLLEENSLHQLGTIVVDELHLIGDPHRGYLLELLLTKIQYMTKYRKQSTDDSIVSADGEGNEDAKKLNIQIIGMSATLPNLELLSSWIDAELVVSNYRPVPLEERICFNGKIFDQLQNLVRDVKLPTLPIEFQADSDNLVYLSLETVLNGHSVLIFCPTKAKCEHVAEQIAREFYKIGNMSESNPLHLLQIRQQLRDQLNSNKIREVLTQLENCPGGLEAVLKKTVSFGVAFHHAEASFKRSVIRVIVATSTLSAGVNLPARRVIVSSPMTYRTPLDVMTYRQMCGRAGRKGVDTEGESILICTDATKDAGLKLVQSSLPFVKSALLGDEGALTSSMKRALLEVIASGIATRPEDVDKYSKCSLLSKSIETGLYEDSDTLPTSQEDKNKTIKECLKFLQDNDFVKLLTYEDAKPDEYMTTQLGSACLASSLSPDDGIAVYKELEKARKCFVLESELHIVYQVTPLYVSDQFRNLPWLDYLNIYNGLSPGDKKVADLVGIEEAFIMRAMIGTVSAQNLKQKDKFMIHQRFFAALALNDLVNETPISTVAETYTLNKGVIQNLQQAASTFAGMVTAFCDRLEWKNIELLLSQFQDRLQFGVQRELCDLVRLSTMNAQRARILYNNGIKTVADLAASDPAIVENILHHAIPFQSAVHGASEGTPQRHIWILGKNDGLSESEASQKIVEEARVFLQIELGLPTFEYDHAKPNEKDDSKQDLLDQSESSSAEDSIVDDREVFHQKMMEASRLSSHRGQMSKSTSLSKENSGRESRVAIPNKVDKHVSFKEADAAVVDDDVFDDSFPKLSSEDLFDGIENKYLGKKNINNDIQDRLGQFVETSTHVVKYKENPNVTPKSNNKLRLTDPDRLSIGDSNNPLFHSTPGRNGFANVFTKNPISSAVALDAAIRQVSPILRRNKMSTSTPKNQTTDMIDEQNNHDNDINTGILAEFRRDFDSVAEKMEISLNISDIENKDKIHKLNDSDHAAMLAIANDSKFYSEDMFADVEGHKLSDGNIEQKEISLKPNVDDDDDANQIDVYTKDILNELVNKSMDFSEAEEGVRNKENFTPNSSKCKGGGVESEQNQILHSTPTRKLTKYSNIFAKNRLSSIAFESKPRTRDDVNEVDSDIIKSRSSDLQINLQDEINTDVMAEFNKEFDSFAEQRIETSFMAHELILPLPTPIKLSESDTAAMLAIANDSNFDSHSQDMFADLEGNPAENLVKVANSNHDGKRRSNSIPEKSSSRQSSTTNITTGTTTGIETSTECETSNSILENSSEFTENSSCMTSKNGSLSARNADQTPTPVCNASVGEHVLKVIKILTPEFIPDEWFQTAEGGVISVGIRIEFPKRATSIAQCGIGSRILGGQKGGLNKNNELEHSIVLYNGGHTMWLYNWRTTITYNQPENDDVSLHSSNYKKRKLAKLFRRMEAFSCSIVLFDAKDKLRRLLQQIGRDLLADIPKKILDPKIAQWMLQFDDSGYENLGVDKMAELHLNHADKHIFKLGWAKELEETFVAWQIIQKMTFLLQERQLWTPFIEVEMPSIIPLLLMECNGFGLDSLELNRMKRGLEYKCAILEIKAYQLADRQFNLSSPQDIKKVLFREMGLKQPSGSKGTGKDVLSKLDHELPKLILEWRKITSALQKVVLPFLQEKSLETNRVHGYYSHFTVTGRVVMSDPSLQCIPKDFDLDLDFSPEEIEDIKENGKIKFGSKLASLLNQMESAKNLASQSQYLRSSLISMRNVFVPCSNEFVLVSADYSQLELRILAHLSQDKGLLETLNNLEGDVFKSIASTWKKLPPDQITSSIRQEAKGIVYGVIYGMGVKTLSEQLEVDISDASRFISDFMRTYPQIRSFLDNTIKSCRENGFIETISGRRRYLPNINSNNPTLRAQAERQAVNSQIQGSASDLVKTAMCKIHTRLGELFPKNSVPVNWVQHRSKSSSQNMLVPMLRLPSSITYLPVLNLHDELIFEVRRSRLHEISTEIRNQMESCIKLNVRIPVVVKVGESWGTLATLE
ncbi:DNA polymerase theta isoform X2 [Folsomia candida]|uniref:DNA polymerase theta isoform X2 n=1 Tax=Folsomia candida TaxID=158441 RepID=UPI001604F602|nr:DNA polymerase theta isoform X2 [Folsomia candida]